MPKVTQKGEPVFETIITQGHHLEGDEASHLLLELLDLLGYSVYRTNDTKHGETVVKLKRHSTSQLSRSAVEANRRAQEAWEATNSVKKE